MISLLIWSKDRACQLDLLLRSIQKNLPNIDLSDVMVLYTYSDDKFKSGYELIRKRFPYVKLYLEDDFGPNTTKLIHMSQPHILLLADDNVIYRKSNISSQQIVKHMEDNDVSCFSLRLGRNTVIQDPSSHTYTHFPSVFYKTTIDQTDVLTWNWTECPRYHNFGYPFAMDAHIYNKEKVIEGLTFKFNTNTQFEGRYCQQVDHFFPHMSCLEYSVSVCNPINCTSESGLPAGNIHSYTTAELNDQYLSGCVVDLSTIETADVIGCHQEIGLTFHASSSAIT